MKSYIKIKFLNFYYSCQRKATVTTRKQKAGEDSKLGGAYMEEEELFATPERAQNETLLQNTIDQQIPIRSPHL